MFHGVFAFFNFFQEGLELSRHGAQRILNIANYFQYRTLYFSYAVTQVASQRIFVIPLLVILFETFVIPLLVIPTKLSIIKNRYDKKVEV